MWGKGGRIKQDGPDDLRLSVGLWKQLDNAFKHVYNKVDFRLDMFRAELLNFFRGKVEFEGPDPKRELVVQTGMAGMKMINDAVLKEAVAIRIGIECKRVRSYYKFRNGFRISDLLLLLTSFHS